MTPSPGGPSRYREIDDDAIAKRYVNTTMSVSECARSFGVSYARVKTILDARGIEVRRRKEPDEDAVVAAYQTYRSALATAAACNIGVKKVREILKNAGAERNEPGRPTLGDPPRPGQRTGSKRESVDW